VLQTENLLKFLGVTLYPTLIAVLWGYKCNHHWFKWVDTFGDRDALSVSESKRQPAHRALRVTERRPPSPLTQTRGAQMWWAELGAGRDVHQQPPVWWGPGSRCTPAALGWTETGPSWQRCGVVPHRRR